MAATPSIPTVQEFMTKKVVVATENMILQDLVKTLIENRVSTLPVVEKKDSHLILVGFVSETDCLKYITNDNFFNQAPSEKVGAIMKKNPLTTLPTHDIFTVSELMLNHNYRHLPVVENGELLGMISRHDLLRGMDQYWENVVQRQVREKTPFESESLLGKTLVVADRN